MRQQFSARIPVNKQKEKLELWEKLKINFDHPDVTWFKDGTIIVSCEDLPNSINNKCGKSSIIPNDNHPGFIQNKDSKGRALTVHRLTRQDIR